MNQELLNYIEESLEKGAGEEQISETLIMSGWKKEDVSQAYAAVLLKNKKEKINTAPVPNISSESKIASSIIIEPIVKSALASNKLKVVNSAAELQAKPVNNQLAKSSSLKKPFKFSFNLKNKFFVAFIFILELALVGAGIFIYFNYYSKTATNKLINELNSEVMVATTTPQIISSTTDDMMTIENQSATSSTSTLPVTEEIASSSVDSIIITTSTDMTVANTDLVTTNNESVAINPPDPNLDSDNDGLSDVQELIYGTDINNPDSDGDTYLDGAELKSGYNPLGKGLLIK
jgi:hypothetical protein